jgi:hypothetical protein
LSGQQIYSIIKQMKTASDDLARMPFCVLH